MFKNILGLMVLMVTICFSHLYSCDRPTSIFIVPFGHSDTEAYFQDGQLFFPDKDIQGDDILSWFRPEGYIRSSFKLTERKDGMVEYQVSYYAKKDAVINFLEFIDNFRNNSFRVIEPFVDDPFNLYGFDFVGKYMNGRFEITTYRDMNCETWSILRYVVLRYKSKC